jgi:hypothetical protein
VSYSVIVDGVEVGTVRSGETRDFPVTFGDHGVRVKHKKLVTEEWGVHLRPGEVGDFLCRTTFDMGHSQFQQLQLEPVDAVR